MKRLRVLFLTVFTCASLLTGHFASAQTVQVGHVLNTADMFSQIYDRKTIPANQPKTSIEIIQAANANDPLAQLLYGISLISQGQKEEGKSWISKSAASGDARAQFALAFFMERSIVKGNQAQARDLYTQAAEKGHSYAQNNLGWIYYGRNKYPSGEASYLSFEQTISVDFEKAFYWFQKAAELGNRSAQNSLGLMYLRGDYVAKDDTAAVSWFEKSAAQQYPKGQYNLAYMLNLGRGIARDIPRSNQLLQASAAQRYVKAELELARAFATADNMPFNPQLAVKLFLDVSEQLDTQSQFEDWAGSYLRNSNFFFLLLDYNWNITKDTLMSIPETKKELEQQAINGNIYVVDVLKNRYNCIHKDMKTPDKACFENALKTNIPPLLTPHKDGTP